MPITLLPEPPSRSDPQNFPARADAFMSALPTFAQQANDLAADVNAKQTAAAQAATDAANDAQAASQSEGNAADSASAASTSAATAVAAAGSAQVHRDAAAASALAAATSAASVDIANLSSDYFGPDEPTTTWPGMRWAHTTNPEMTEGYIKRRNAANTGWVVEGRLFIDASQATNVGYDNSYSGLVAVNVQAAIDEIVSGRGRFISEAFAIWDHLSGAEIPDNSGSAKFIKLTAGDPYNAGLLTSESVTGSAPNVIATAVIDLTDSPLHGQTINLWNTERRIPRAGEAGVLEGHATEDLFAKVYARGGFVQERINTPEWVSNSGASLPASDATGNYTQGTGIGALGTGETRMKNQGVTYYMRIK